MNSKLLHFLFALACAALIGLGPLRAQSPTSSSDANGAAVTQSARHSDASYTAVSPSSAPQGNSVRDVERNANAQKAADTTIANDRGTIAPNQPSDSRFSAGWIGLLGLLGLLGLIRRPRVQRASHAAEPSLRREDIRRVA